MAGTSIYSVYRRTARAAAKQQVVKKTSATVQTNFLAPSQKELIRNGVLTSKIITDEPVFQDPVYMAISFGVLKPKEDISPSIVDYSKLVLERSPTAKKNEDEIKQQAEKFNKAKLHYQSIQGTPETKNHLKEIVQSLIDLDS